MSAAKSQNASVQLCLGTLSFVVCFAAWGLISSFAPRFRETFHLSATQTAFLVAVPVILGALARLPMGMLADLYGGRIVFAVLMLVAAVPPLWAIGCVQLSHATRGGILPGTCGLVVCGRRRVCFAMVSAAESKARRSVFTDWATSDSRPSCFLGPVLAATFGWQVIFRGISVLLVVWAIVFFLFARNSPKVPRPKGLGEMLHVLRHERLAWVLSAFYGLTFGGFVAFSIYLPTLLKDQFHLTASNAGLRTAGFVVLATLVRPLGGWLSDRIGGAQVLSVVFFGIVPFSLLLAWPSMVPVHGGRSWVRGSAGVGQWRGVQTGPAVLQERYRHRYGPGGRHGRPGRFFSAAAAWASFSIWQALSGPVSYCCR